MKKSYIGRGGNLLMPHNQDLSLRDQLKPFEHHCRKAGLKLTHQRLEIYRELASTDDHPSADQVYSRVQARLPTISLDTVYRTLLTFEHSELVARVYAFNNRARFDANLVPHQHLACTRCKSIKDFHWQPFEEMKPPAETKQWGDIMSKDAVLRGVCRKCSTMGRKKSK